MKQIGCGTLLTACIAHALLITACGGGGGQTVKADPPPPPPPTSAPPPEPCPAPITTPCTVTAQYTLTFDEYGMTGGRQTDQRLSVMGPGGSFNLKNGEYRFSGGTEIAGATLVVWDTLVSNVSILRDGSGLGFQGTSVLWLGGTIRGNVRNDELLTLRHLCGTGLNLCTHDRPRRIEGNYVQTGTLEAVLGDPLQITGTTDLAGEVRFIPGTSQSYVLPSAPSSILVLHANGGITGQFGGWQGAGLFLSGSLRHTPNDVFFDATRISVQGAIAASAGADALTSATAARVDDAFSVADGFAGADPASLSGVQRQFLSSAASVMHAGNAAQAIRTLDSLSGHGHAGAPDMLRAQAAGFAASMDARMNRLVPGSAPAAWSTSSLLEGTTPFFVGTASGYDEWLGHDLMVGGSVGNARADRQFDRMGGQVCGTAPLASVHALYRSGGWHLAGLVGAGRANLQLTRPIDLGAGRQEFAWSQRDVDQAFAHVEFGRDWTWGPSRFSPYLTLDHNVMRTAGFAELGSTGFELVAEPATTTRTTAATGMRLSRRWSLSGGWIGVDVDARYARGLANDGEASLAAFAATPGADFALLGTGGEADSRSFMVGLAGMGPGPWTWSARFGRQLDASMFLPSTHWSFGLRREF
ncbi:hypothetical protein GCM10023332_02940 [Luteimonas vadosa]|uniref:Autotransporter domain-containing protein n=2 Tax=Luteimonas vadosa TaxID=1165507 RepID=A0ABP9DNU4_9GAMM